MTNKTFTPSGKPFAVAEKTVPNANQQRQKRTKSNPLSAFMGVVSLPRKARLWKNTIGKSIVPKQRR